MASGGGNQQDPRQGRMGGASATAFPVASMAVLLALLPSCDDPSQSMAEGPIAVVAYARDVIQDQAWEMLQQTSGDPVCVDVLTPAIKPSGKRGPEWSELRSLVLPPRASVAIDVRPEDGPVRLKAFAGVDRESFVKLPKQARVRVSFEVDVNGRTVWSGRVLVARRRLHENRWLPVGPPEGLALKPGERVVLRTDFADGSFGGIRAGFGMLRLERTEPVLRTLSGPDRPNLVLIVVDTLRADRLGCYGYRKDTTPHVDRLAGRGLLFDEALATSSWTWPSTTSILTGLAPEQHGVISMQSCYLAPELVTLPEVLQAAGFTCGAFSANPLVVPQRGFDQGFEHFDYDVGLRTGDELVPSALDWVREHAGNRFFLYLHLADPHAPHRPRPEQLARLGGSQPIDFPVSESKAAVAVYTDRLRKEGFGPQGEPRPDKVIPEAHVRWIQDAYDASTASADHWIGELLAQLDELGLLDHTVVAVTSDHGEELLERGMLGHGHSLYRELVRVPLVLAGPDLPRGSRVATPVSHIHLASTLAGLVDVPFQECGEAAGGINLSRPEEIRAEPVYFSTMRGFWNGRTTQLQSMREGRWRLIWALDGASWGSTAAVEQGDLRLYDMTRDPLQQHDVAAAHPEQANAMRSRLAEHSSQSSTKSVSRDNVGSGVGAAGMEALRELGYVE